MQRLALVVEDNLIDQALLKKSLKKINIMSISVDNGYDAINCLTENYYDMIFLDINLPFINGYEFLRRVKGYVDRHKIPVIMMSADRLDQESVLSAHKYGACDFLVKPINNESLKNKVDQHIRIVSNKNKWHHLSEKCLGISEIDIQLIKLNKQQLVFESRNAFVGEQEVSLQAPFLASIGIDKIQVTIENVTPNKENYIYHASFKKTANKHREIIYQFLDQIHDQ